MSQNNSDEVLLLQLLAGCSIVDFTDNIAKILVDLIRFELSLPAHKTETVLVSSQQIVEKMNVIVRDSTIEPTTIIR